MFTSLNNYTYVNYLYQNKSILHNTEVRGFQIIFGKPVNGQRTASNAMTAKKQQTILYHYKYNQLRSAVGTYLTKPLFLSEYIMLFWQQQ